MSPTEEEIQEIIKEETIEELEIKKHGYLESLNEINEKLRIAEKKRDALREKFKELDQEREYIDVCLYTLDKYAQSDNHEYLEEDLEEAEKKCEEMATRLNHAEMIVGILEERKETVDRSYHEIVDELNKLKGNEESTTKRIGKKRSPYKYYTRRTKGRRYKRKTKKMGWTIVGLCSMFIGMWGTMQGVMGFDVSNGFIMLGAFMIAMQYYK